MSVLGWQRRSVFLCLIFFFCTVSSFCIFFCIFLCIFLCIFFCVFFGKCCCVDVDEGERTNVLLNGERRKAGADVERRMPNAEQNKAQTMGIDDCDDDDDEGEDRARLLVLSWRHIFYAYPGKRRLLLRLFSLSSFTFFWSRPSSCFKTPSLIYRYPYPH
jgi:hypothetical protein